MTQVWRRPTLMRLFSLEVHLVSPKYVRLLKTSSTVKMPTLVSTPMKLFVLELPFKVVSYVVRRVKRLKDLSLSMPPPCPSVLRLLEVSWPRSSPKVHTFPQRSHRSSLPTKTTNKPCLFRSLRENVPWLKITTCWVNLISQVSLLPLEEYPKLK